MIRFKISFFKCVAQTLNSVTNSTVTSIFILVCALVSSHFIFYLRRRRTVIILWEVIASNISLLHFNDCLGFQQNNDLIFHAMSTGIIVSCLSWQEFCRVVDFFSPPRSLSLLLINPSVTWRTLTILGFCLILVLGGRTHPFFMVDVYHCWFIGAFLIHRKKICLNILHQNVFALYSNHLISCKQVLCNVFHDYITDRFWHICMEAYCCWGRGSDFLLLNLCAIPATIFKKNHI